jgi:hypothetical protein
MNTISHFWFIKNEIAFVSDTVSIHINFVYYWPTSVQQNRVPIVNDPTSNKIKIKFTCVWSMTLYLI